MTEQTNTSISNEHLTDLILDRTPAPPAPQDAVKRDHFRKLYERNPLDVAENSESASVIFKAAEQKFGSSNVRFDQYPAKGGGHDFPVLLSDHRVVNSGAASNVLLNVPPIATEFIFIAPDKRDKALTWLEANRKSIIKQRKNKHG